jgi:hypothetical protein
MEQVNGLSCCYDLNSLRPLSLLTIIGLVYDRNAPFLRVRLCFLDISCSNGSNNNLSMGSCWNDQGLWASTF